MFECAGIQNNRLAILIAFVNRALNIDKIWKNEPRNCEDCYFCSLNAKIRAK